MSIGIGMVVVVVVDVVVVVVVVVWSVVMPSIGISMVGKLSLGGMVAPVTGSTDEGSLGSLDSPGVGVGPLVVVV